MSDYRFHNRCIDLYEVSEVLKPLMDLVRHIPLSHEQDAIVWGEIMNGLYSVASNYEYIQI